MVNKEIAHGIRALHLLPFMELVDARTEMLIASKFPYNLALYKYLSSLYMVKFKLA